MITGVTIATMLIGVVLSWKHISNISLLYLPVVLWLAARYGRGPAILASALSFLSYDFFFIPPVHRFTVNEPTEWLSLFALLATSLALGQMTATVRARAQEAEESQTQTETLYRVAQLIAESGDERSLATSLTREIVSLFGVNGVLVCDILTPDEHGALTSIAHWSSIEDNALDHTLTGDPSGDGRYALLRKPLIAPGGVVGQLVVAGFPSLRQLAPDPFSDASSVEEREEHMPNGNVDSQATVFSAVCDQIALALEHAVLAREAAHVAALRESDRLKDILLGSVTHDLRTPLASIKAATTSLLQNDIEWSAPERRELLESMDTSADRLNRLVGNLLDLSRLEAGVAQPELDWSLMSDVVATVLDRLDLSGQTRGHPIEVDEPADLPLTQMDYAQIEQVMTNLLENALKHSPEGSVITIRVTPQTHELEVAVIDHGIGIPAGEREAVFDKFYRVQRVHSSWSSSRPPTGTGLGLAICASIIHEHGGRIWAEETPGGGATLIFTLPLALDRPQGALPEVDGQAQETHR
ncbi:MAG TPA: ATP-binding protein [Ktedonobacterales bacterium]